MKHKLLGILFILFVLSSCKDDDNDGPSDNEIPVGSTGNVNATLNGSAFVSDSIRARERSSGGMFIVATDQNGRSLEFYFENFIGNGSYAVGPQLNVEAEFSDVVNGNLVLFENGTGSFFISNYQESTKSFDAEFSLVFNSEIDPGITIEGSGNFSNTSILTIPEPNEGDVILFNNDKEYYTEYTATAWTTHTGLLWMTLEGENSLEDKVIAVDLAEILNPSKIDYTDGLQFGTSQWHSVGTSGIINWEYDEANQLVSGQIKSLGRGDYEVRFNKIPVDVVELANTVAGDIFFFSGGDTIRFDEAELIVEQNGPVTTRNFEALNSDGQKLSFQTTFDGSQEANEPYRGPLNRMSLHFTDDSGVYPSESHGGRFRFTEASELPSDQRYLIFEATDREAIMYARGVDLIIVE